MGRFDNMGRQTFSGRKPYILFLSTGNTCRSPMAMGVMREFMQEVGIDYLDIRTAGVMTISGLMPTPECRQLVLKDGLDISFHRSSPATPSLIENAALVLGMTSYHVQMALRLTDNAREKTYLLKEFTGVDAKNGQIQDPMGCTMEVYKKVYREIKAACKKLCKLEALQQYKPSGSARPKTLEATSPKPASKPLPDPVKKKPAKKKKSPEKEKAKKTTSAKAKPVKKAAVKKKAAEKTTKKTAAKAAPTKKTAKKSTVKKTAAKKAAPKKSVAKKAAIKKAAPKKSVAKKSAAQSAPKKSTKTGSAKSKKGKK